MHVGSLPATSNMTMSNIFYHFHAKAPLNLAGDDVRSSNTLSDSVEQGESLAQHYQKVYLSWERHLRLLSTIYHVYT